MPFDGNGRKPRRPGEVVVSTELVESGLRTDYWREATRLVFDTLPVDGSEARLLEGTIRSRPAGGLLFGAIGFNAQRYNRDRRLIVQGGLDNYMIQVFTAGSMAGDLGGRNVRPGPGDICILDLAQTIDSEVTAGSRITAAIPRAILGKAVGYRNLHGAVLKAHLPMTGLIAAYIRGLVDLQNALSGEEVEAVQEALVTLLTAALRGEQPESVDTPPLSMALRQRVLDFIDSHIDHPDLSPGFILQRLNVSRAHLYRAFAGEGGVSTVIRNRRLDAAFLELTRAASSSRTIARIADDLGFSSTNQLLRSFRARFGMTPSEAREEGLASLPHKGQGTAGLQDFFTALSGRT